MNSGSSMILPRSLRDKLDTSPLVVAELICCCLRW